MNIDLLIKMANEIGTFFSGADADGAASDVANHLKRYWAPRMRAQIIKYYEERAGAGLSDVAKAAVAQLDAASKASAAAAPAAVAPAAAPPGAAPAKGPGT